MVAQNDSTKTSDDHPAETARTEEKSQDRASKAQQLFEIPYNNYLKTLQDIQKDWYEETQKQLADHKRAQFEGSLAQKDRTWHQTTLLPLCSSTVQQVISSAWKTIGGQGRTEEAYTVYVTQLKNGLADVKQDDLSPALLNGIANCMKVVACYAHYGRSQSGDSK